MSTMRRIIIFQEHAPESAFGQRMIQVNMDNERFFGMSRTSRMIAIETGWYERVKKGSIYRYIFDAADFELEEENAGYHVSRRPVIPMEVQRIDDLITAILNEGIELRITPSLQPLREQVLKSTVNFSMIRMRNARQE
ncbi:DUF6886 family protein [Paenibacillus cineris]|nr:DUF6886 family protein [Paenibacillus cineris]